jgi:hypothetical protein
MTITTLLWYLDNSGLGPWDPIYIRVERKLLEMRAEEEARAQIELDEQRRAEIAREIEAPPKSVIRMRVARTRALGSR